MGGPASDILPSHYDTDLNLGNNTDQDLAGLFASLPMGYRYASSIASSDCTGDGREDTRRPRFQPSECGDSTTTASSVSYDADGRDVFSVRGGRGGGHGSIFSNLHDAKTAASITEAESMAQRAMDAALLGAVDELPEIVTVEFPAPSNIVHPHHWNNIGVDQSPTGLQASSATAMASWNASSPGARSTTTSLDATEVVAHLPCEFARYKGCTLTFPLHRSEAGIGAWADHMAKTHMAYRMPRISGCWFCDEKFPIHHDDYAKDRVAVDVYNRRLKHIARHYLRQGPQHVANPRPDTDFEAHLIANGILDVPAGHQPRVPSGNDLRPPMQDHTKLKKRIRSARSEVHIITERAPRHNGRGRLQARQVTHYE
ncbi:hypothetical protein A9K55_008122 [Cordyceps militaris]|uniref:Uncharacterized protein n=1 Tax=Cordyceps militaris TaxID=73501 RepID=A0A2H4SF48_CORMI|nr:hypothetical protein A9K55_008122 [Cordyceps militaris]